MRIVLEKPHLSDSLGFSLVHRRTDGQSGIFIKTLTPGGIAHTNRQLRVGDRLLQVGSRLSEDMGVKKLWGKKRNEHTKNIHFAKKVGGREMQKRLSGIHVVRVAEEVNKLSLAVSRFIPIGQTSVTIFVIAAFPSHGSTVCSR